MLTSVSPSGSAAAIDARPPQPAAAPARTFASVVRDGSRPADDRAAFERWWKQIPRLEGTLADWQASPHRHLDRGGRTHYGITERAFMGCAGAAGLPKTPEAFENMTIAEAKQIARAIWKTAGAHRIEHPGVATAMGDWFWGSNTGAWRGLGRVLESMGVCVDTRAGLGPDAIAALNQLPPEQLIERISSARAEHHQQIVAADPTQGVFLSGWQARVALMQAQALEFVSRAGEPESPALRHRGLRG